MRAMRTSSVMVLVAALCPSALLACSGDDGPGSTVGDTAGGGATGTGTGTGTTANDDDPVAGNTAGNTTEATTEAPGTSTGTADTATTNATDPDTGEGTAGPVGLDYAQIQLELENVGGKYGAYPSCTAGGPCHSNPDRNIHIVEDPSPAEMMQNWVNITNVPAGVTPWVTPLDDTAQMLLEVPVPDDVRARWLKWIEAGAPY